VLASGMDPLKQIQQQVRQLKPGQVLKIINSFEPVPLLKLLEKQGFHTYMDQVNERQVETYFYKPENVSAPNLEPAINTSPDWDQVLKRFEGKLILVDVRRLEMPQPMMTILEALENLSREHALYVHHKRIPVFLLTELKERDFDYRIREIAEGEVYLIIFHN
jgi:uncharacterized protein (DUF2249 family)